SQLADKGIDITPEISLAKGLTRDWWIGGELAGVISTSHNEGNRQGYIALTAWALWFSRWLPNETDAFKLSVWAATNEVPEDSNALSISLDYEFDISDHLEAVVGVGVEPYSSSGNHGAYLAAGLRWQF
ncbi:MAG: hypothetical protein K8R87_08235, partial [Verrucomicrobia bacterium]|nr:hypothetical protein [Verrucomicrobiota bacterium]